MEKYNILVVINNKSGKGNAESFFYKLVKSKLSNFNINLFKISLFGEFEKYIDQNLEYFENLKCLVIMGGDGTVHTIYNTLLSKNLNIPIAIIPIGTGNGLLKSITYETNQDYSIKQSLTIINKNNILNGDVIEINKNNNKFYSLLAITWGLISDIDILTEPFRFLGSFRFDLGAVWFLLRKHSYQGKLTYIDELGETKIIEGKFIHFWACNTSWASENTFSSKLSKLNDGYIYISYILEPLNRCKLLQVLLKMNKGEYVFDKNVKYIKTKQFNLQTRDGKIVIDGELKDLRNINCKLIPNKIKYLS